MVSKSVTDRSERMRESVMLPDIIELYAVTKYGTISSRCYIRELRGGSASQMATRLDAFVVGECTILFTLLCRL